MCCGVSCRSWNERGSRLLEQAQVVRTLTNADVTSTVKTVPGVGLGTELLVFHTEILARIR